ncbi:MAG: FeoB-associated Cys-rich membrane protein [Oscillospiraceae bacterium]|nr:FeoB-associated Cys-rich membrane protein [Oscillospiraceae bacterium]
MNFVDYLVVAVIAAILLLAALYVYKSKKSGKKCIGCPHGCCSSTQGGGCSGNCSDCSCGK